MKRYLYMYFRHDNLRQGQNEFIKDISFCLENKKIGLFEAPTGMGKTDASLAATLEFAEKHNKKIFFVTPKNSQHKIVMDVVKGINEKKSTNFKVVDLVAKSNLCIDPFLYGLGSEFYDLCEKKVKNKACIPYLNAIGKGRLQNRAMINFMENAKDVMSSSELREDCLNYQICPYITTLILAKKAKVIVCDVNHIFVDSIRNSLFNYLKISLDDCIFIFDEGHNLPNRIRSILSDSLSIKQVHYAMREYEKCPKDYNLTDFLETLEHKITKLNVGFVDDNYFDDLFSDEQIMEALLTAGDFILETEKKKPNLFKVASFISSWMVDKKVKAKYVKNNTVYLKGLNPAFLSSHIFNESFGSILMSATFSPIQMYVDILGISSPFVKQYSGPFPKENKIVQYVDSVTTKYKERSESIPKIAKIIKDTVNKVSRNIAVFFPSYDILDSIYLRVSEQIIKKIYVQRKKMSVQDTKRLVNKFKKNKIGFGSVLFAVVGGSFSEGVDYPDDDLIGIIIVGFPFPELDYEIESLIKFYDSLGKSGWNYAYLYPTVSKVVQACGRAIRSETDKAFILLLDKRFGWPRYKSLFPVDYNITLFNQKKFTDFIRNL